MAYQRISNARITAVCSCIPRHIERTINYTHVSEEERNLFVKTTGIKERRVASENVTCSDLCFTAASHLLSKFNCAEEIDLIVFVSQSPDYFLPATSVVLQKKLNLRNECLAFDMNLGCSGYVYGLSVISSMLQGGYLKKALLLAGDKSTISTSYTDKSTYPLFGDAGTATLIEYDPGQKDWHFNLQSDGSGKDAIIIEQGHSRHPYGKDMDEIIEIEPGISRAKKHLSLKGMDIFNFALKEVTPNINSLLAQSGIEQKSIDYFVFHQANKLINETIRKKIKAESERTPYSIELFGNTSSASIPLTMCYAMKDVLKNKKLTLLLSGFGVGFSWGSVIIQTENIYSELIEYGT